MNKNILVILTIFLILLITISTWMYANTNKYRQMQNKNYEYEQYLEEEIYGTEVITLINKAINNNEQYNVSKNEKELYISDEQNSIIIEMVMIIDEATGQAQTYRMETINKVGITEFINNFNTAKFKIQNIEYHKSTGKVAKIIIKQQ